MEIKKLTNEQLSDQQIVFALATMKNETDMPALLIGVSEKAWEYMSDGKTHTFDLKFIGLPIQIVLFGGKDLKEIKDTYTSILERIASDGPTSKINLN